MTKLGIRQLAMLRRYADGQAFVPLKGGQPPILMQGLVRSKLMLAEQLIHAHWEPLRYPGARDIGTWSEGDTEYRAGLTAAGRAALEQTP